MDVAVSYDPGGGTTSTTLELLDLRGDVAATANLAGVGLAAAYGYDEFGDPVSPNGLTYGWLGGKTRAGAGVGNLTLMGVRLYDPATGRFLQTDPVPGGSANPYDYCSQDPINCYDLQGTWWGSDVLKKAVKIVKKAAKATTHYVDKHWEGIAQGALIAGLALTGFGLTMDMALIIGDATEIAMASELAEGLEATRVAYATQQWRMGVSLVTAVGAGLAGTGYWMYHNYGHEK